MFTIMHNVYINQVRAGASAVVSPLDDETVQPAIRATQSDRLEVLDLQTALLSLPEDQREVLLLVGLEQMTYDEAAGVLNVPIGTVMSRLSRAREKLRMSLKGGAQLPAGLKVVK
jgi:RNA polymerase sigma-70 factor (ECF subfamily)